MIFHQVQTILDKIKYKDWVFRASKRYGDDFLITVEHEVEDSDEAFAGVEEPTVALSSRTVAFNAGVFSSLRGGLEQIVCNQVWQMIMEMERHEAGEWFIYDGQRPKYPHEPHATKAEVVNLANPCAAVDLSDTLSPLRA